MGHMIFSLYDMTSGKRENVQKMMWHIDLFENYSK